MLRAATAEKLDLFFHASKLVFVDFISEIRKTTSKLKKHPPSQQSCLGWKPSGWQSFTNADLD